jgi:nitrogen regulatory protein PII
MDYSLIITIVNKGFSELVMDAAKEKGARGGTVLSGHGTGSMEAQKFFNFIISEEKETVFIVVNKELRQEIMTNIAVKAGLNTKGQGVVFALPVDETVGFNKPEEREEKKEKEDAVAAAADTAAAERYAPEEE